MKERERERERGRETENRLRDSLHQTMYDDREKQQNAKKTVLGKDMKKQRFEEIKKFVKLVSYLIC